MENIEYDTIRLHPSPIVEAMVELQCSFYIPEDVVIGIIYSLLQKKDSHLELKKLPINAIPEEIRKIDPNLRNKPTHQIICSEGVLSIGTNSITMSIPPPYQTWNIFKSFINYVLDIIKSSSAPIKKGVNRVRIKYLNFFELNNFDNNNLEIIYQNSMVKHIPTIFRTEIPAGAFINILQISNGVNIKNPALKLNAYGSLIDITVVSNKVALDTVENAIDLTHNEAKKLFFSLLKEEFINALIL
jgi:uncharacterized protein (TIGR04255 family)